MSARLEVSDLLEVWERGFGASSLERRLDLLAATSEERTREEIAELPIGRRDAELFELRRWMFGRDLDSTAACPECNERLEMSLRVEDLLVESPQPATGSVSVEGFVVDFRVPSTADLIAASPTSETDAGTMRTRVLDRCVSSARGPSGDPVAAAALPEKVVAGVAAAMAEADPQADVTLALACPECAHQWDQPFDIASFLWTELDGWARRVLRDVALLAHAYGWSEHDVLALSPARRRLYIELAGL